MGQNRSLGICKTLGALALSSHVSYRKVASTVWLRMTYGCNSSLFMVFPCFLLLLFSTTACNPIHDFYSCFPPVGTERSASVSAGSWRIRWITRRLGHLKTWCLGPSYTAAPREPCQNFVCCAQAWNIGWLQDFYTIHPSFSCRECGAWPIWSKPVVHQRLLYGMEWTKQHIKSSECHAKPQCWANIFGSKSNSFF